ncbi:MAG: tetratricopeptide repeat protein [Planctomycetota bacterium]|nr:tetratricopeptide repeat protein [Planctomycetota bacterium]
MTINDRLARAVQLHESGSHAEAEAIYVEIINEEPNHADALHLLGLIYFERQNWGPALAALGRAVAVRPEAVAYSKSLARAMLAAQMFNKAAELLALLADRFPSDADFASLYGQVLLQLNRLTDARQSLERAIALKPDQLDSLWGLGLVHGQLSEFEPAQAYYESALRISPDSVTILNNLGEICRQKHDWEAAKGYFERGLKVDPSIPELHSNLGLVLAATGCPNEAIEHYEQAVVLRPNYRDPQINKAALLHDTKQYEAARGQLETAAAISPLSSAEHKLFLQTHLDVGEIDAAKSYFHKIAATLPPADQRAYLGLIEHHAENYEAAVEHYFAAIESDANHEVVHCALSDALQHLGRNDESLAAAESAVRIIPNDATTRTNLGVIQFARGLLEEARQSFGLAAEMDPRSSKAHMNLGHILRLQEHYAESEAYFRQAERLDPESALIQKGLGQLFAEQGRYAEAITCLKRAIKISPDLIAAHVELAGAHVGIGEVRKAVVELTSLLDKPDSTPVAISAHSNFLFYLQHCPGITNRELNAAHAVWNARHAVPLGAEWRPHTNTTDPDRKLRVGFVSPNFSRHPCSYFLVRALKHFQSPAVHLTCYSDVRTPDDMTHRISTSVPEWRSTIDLDDEQLCQQIRSDRIDILIAMAGHTQGNRLLAFARKPAPIQLSWTGYAGSTGVSAFDYLIADRFHVPPECDSSYPERILRLPDGYVCYEAPAYAADVSTLPAIDNGYVTFGSFNKPSKLNDDVLVLWADILSRIPDSRLLLKFRGMTDRQVTLRIRGVFVDRGIDAERLQFVDATPNPEHLAWYRNVDIGLDPFPYSGGLTTCEAMWMGVPVVTLGGETFASRHSLSHLSNVGLDSAIASTPADYVERASSLCEDLARLAVVRRGLRQEMSGSPLCDGKRFAESFEQACRQIWSDWCRNRAI